MDFAATAVLDLPTQPSAVKSARGPADDQSPSFEDHLDSAGQEDAPAIGEKPSARTTGKKSSANEEPSPAMPAAELQPPQQPLQASPLLALVNLAASAPPASPPESAADTPGAILAASKGDAPNSPAAAPEAAGAAPAFAAPPSGEALPPQPKGAASDGVGGASGLTPQQQAPELPALVPFQLTPLQVAPPMQPQQQQPKTDTPRIAATGQSFDKAQPKAELNALSNEPAPGPFQAALKAANAQPKTTSADSLVAALADPDINQQQAPQAPPPALGNLQNTQPVQATAQPERADHAVPAAAQIAREIVRRFDGETTQFELRLDPPELGRVDVRLEVSRDHRVTAVVAADNPQALQELVRHARDLQQSLQSAGLQLADNGLSFDLRQGSEHNAQAQNGRTAGGGGDEDGDAAPAAQIVSARPPGLERWRGVRLDITV